MVHDFKSELDFSQQHSRDPWWRHVYKAAFPNIVGMALVDGDGAWAQVAGVDRVLVLGDGRVVRIDEKVRREDYNDFLLERYSNLERKTPGWIQKNLATDFIAYVFLPSGRCYFLPFLPLRRAWRLNGRRWIQQYPHVPGKNPTYTTECIAVPIPVVLAAIADATLVAFDPQLAIAGDTGAPVASSGPRLVVGG